MWWWLKAALWRSTWHPLLYLQVLVRVVNAGMIAGSMYLIVAGHEYCNPKCGYKFNCIDMTMQKWQAYEIDGQFVALAALVLLEGLVVVCLLLCPLIFVECSHKVPVIVCALAFAGTGGLAYVQAHFSACPWDDQWKHDLQAIRDVNAARYEEILLELQVAHSMNERDLFCLMYAPCRVSGWAQAALLLSASAGLFLLDSLLSCRRQMFGFFGGHARYVVYSGEATRDQLQLSHVPPPPSHHHDATHCNGAISVIGSDYAYSAYQQPYSRYSSTSVTL